MLHSYLFYARYPIVYFIYTGYIISWISTFNIVLNKKYIIPMYSIIYNLISNLLSIC